VGKSSQVVRACDLVGAQRILVIVNASARTNWLREFRKFSPLDRDAVALLDGAGRPVKPGVTVCSYNALVRLPRPNIKKEAAKVRAKYKRREQEVTEEFVAAEAKNRATAKRKLARDRDAFRSALAAIEWDVLILDEAHYLKSRTAGCTRAVYGEQCDGKTGLASLAKRVWRLTGTPAPNNVSELWTHLRSAGLYEGKQDAFTHEFCTGYESNYGFRITGTRNADRLRGLLDGFMLRRKKEEVLPTLPGLHFEHVQIEPGEVDVASYFPEDVIHYGPKKLAHDIEVQNHILRAAWRNATNASRTTRRDATSALTDIGPSVAKLRKYVGLAKLPGYSQRIREELDSGEIDKIVIFAWNRDLVVTLRDMLRKYKPVTLYGGTPPKKVPKIIDKFQNNEACRVFIGNLKSAGTAITLTRANHVDVLQESYVPGENAQAVMRCHRIGQDRDVYVRFFGCAGSVDDEITRAWMQKTRELAKVID